MNGERKWRWDDGIHTICKLEPSSYNLASSCCKFIQFVNLSRVASWYNLVSSSYNLVQFGVEQLRVWPIQKEDSQWRKAELIQFGADCECRRVQRQENRKQLINSSSSLAMISSSFGFGSFDLSGDPWTSSTSWIYELSRCSCSWNLPTSYISVLMRDISSKGDVNEKERRAHLELNGRDKKTDVE